MLLPENSSDAVSVLIPTFRRPDLLRRAILSVLAQEHPNVRACVFDNASGDRTSAVVAEIRARDPRVRYHCHDSNLGAVANFQYALANVETPFFSLLSDDDFLLPGFVSAAINGLQRHPDAAMACCDVLNMNPQGDVVRERALADCPEGRYDCPDGLLAMVRHGTPTITGVVFRRDLVANEFDEEVGAAADMHFVARTAARHPFLLTHTTGAVFAPVSIAEAHSLRSSLAAFWPGWLRMIEDLAGTAALTREASQEVRERLTVMLVRYLSFIGAAAVIRGDFEEALRTADVLQMLQKPRRADAITLSALACRDLRGAHAVARRAFQARATIRHIGHRLRAVLSPDLEALRIERAHINEIRFRRES